MSPSLLFGLLLLLFMTNLVLAARSVKMSRLVVDHVNDMTFAQGWCIPPPYNMCGFTDYVQTPVGFDHKTGKTTVHLRPYMRLCSVRDKFCYYNLKAKVALCD
ncbi:hypothetical protein E4U41_004822 [Claviceps citrina]|nr:hypothetical protein E4U41_004822 [Claviceps citrina]